MLVISVANGHVETPRLERILPAPQIIFMSLRIEGPISPSGQYSRGSNLDVP
jgi:hypothetical protein